MEKNVIVVDEQGNEYEATYPKRAKGLVKSGRARFIDENKICLACPPDKLTEDNKMSENKVLTTKDIFEQIALLQKQIMEFSYHSPHRLTDAVDSIYSSETSEENEARSESVSDVTAVFAAREETLAKMLSIYERMYNDIVKAQERKISLITEAFQSLSSNIKVSDLSSEDKAAAFGDLSRQIAQMVDKVIFDSTPDESL